MDNLLNAFKFFSDNIHILGWASLLICAIKLTWKASKFFDDITASLARTERLEIAIEVLSTNHLPHLQMGIDKLDGSVQALEKNFVGELKGVRSDLLQYALRKD